MIILEYFYRYIDALTFPFAANGNHPSIVGAAGSSGSVSKRVSNGNHACPRKSFVPGERCMFSVVLFYGFLMGFVGHRT